MTDNKVKLYGKEKYTNTETGEVIEVTTIDHQNADSNFDKIWLGHVLSSIGAIGNKKMEVLCYLLKERNSENTIVATQRKIAKDLGIGTQVVSKTLKALQDCDFMRKINSGTYQINPNFIFKGTKERRLNVLLKYRK